AGGRRGRRQRHRAVARGLRAPSARPRHEHEEEPVKCAICGKDCRETYLNLGGYCGDEHRREIQRRHRLLLDELRLEDPLTMPDLFSVPDFDRFALKLAVFLLDRISPEVRELFRQRVPPLLEPLEMSLELKERILRQLPSGHVALEEAVGLASEICTT